MNNDVDRHRTLPQSLDAEKGLLCSCLLSGTVLDELTSYPPEMFYHPAHQTVFDLIRSMRNRSVPVDFIGIARELELAGDAGKGLEEVGGAGYVTELFTFVPTAANWSFYRETVADCWKARRVIGELSRVVGAAYSALDGEGIDALLEDVETSLFSLRDDRKIEEDILDSAQLANELMDAVEVAHSHRGRTVGVPSGFFDIDRMLGGFMPEELYLIAARPSQGKSSLALNMIRHALFGDDKWEGCPVALFSLEMPAVDQAKRLAADLQGIELQKFRDGFFSQVDLDKVGRAAAQIGSSKFFVCKTPGLSVQAWRVKARRLVQKHGVKIIFIDYLQLMRSTSKRAQDNRQAEVAEISTMLKNTARELGVPVVALAQLSRDAENRKPTLAQLRESGQLEQDADAVIFIYRPQKNERDEDTGEALQREEALAIIAKQRNGPVGEVDLDFVGKFTRFENVTGKRYSNNQDQRQGAKRRKGADSEDD